MGATGSSSKRKSSSLKKNKRSKSEVRKRKRSRRNKSKKLRQRDDTVPYSDEDYSRSSGFVMPSSSDEDYRSKRARSRTRKDVKGSRKRARRGSSSHDPTREAPRIKKRKGLKRNGDSDARKKSQKKKPRRDAIISSTSSDSLSCSTCQGGSSGSDKSELERTRGRSRGKEKDKRNSGRVKSGSKKSRYRSRSCSSCSRCSESSNYRSEERLTGENNLRRLRSVITFTKEPEENEGRELEKDEHKEEIIYDHDDYPSCRSNDSNDGGIKRESARSLHVAEKKRQVENVKGEEAVVSNIRTAEIKESGKDGAGLCEGSNSTFDGVGANNSLKENKSEISAAIGSPNGDDLESILRQRALENLRKFRGGLQTNARAPADQKDRSDSELKQSSTAKAESVQIKFHKEDGARVLNATQVVDQGSMLTIGRESTSSSRNDGKIPDGKYGGIESGAAKQDVVSPPDQVAIADNPKQKVNITVGAVTNKARPGTSALRRESSVTYTTLKQAPTLQASPKAKLLVTKSSVDKSAVETSQTATQSSNNHSVKANNSSGSPAPEPSPFLKPTSGEHSSKELQNEAKEGSQFEQKTMSVMRGGEMVQVSYKVYIPKKAPALARRQLQR